MAQGRQKKEEGRKKREERRMKKEGERMKKEEGRRNKEESRGCESVSKKEEREPRQTQNKKIYIYKLPINRPMAARCYNKIVYNN